MSLYLRETYFKDKNGKDKVVKNLVKLSSKEKFWKKEKELERRNREYLSYEKNKKDEVQKVISRTKNGICTVHTLMQKSNKVR